jgi:hypothetical protein
MIRASFNGGLNMARYRLKENRGQFWNFEQKSASEKESSMKIDRK